MKHSKKLLLILSGVMLFACSKGNSSSTTSQAPSSDNTSQSTSGTETTNIDKFVEAYNKLGVNYVSQDAYYTSFGGDVTSSISQMYVEPHAAYNFATRSGIALGQGTITTSQGAQTGKFAYRFGLDTSASSDAASFCTTYTPYNFYYQGLMAEQGLYLFDEDTYKNFYGIASSKTVETFAKSLYGRSISFKSMFQEGTDENGNVTFTSTNVALALYFLETNAFALMPGNDSNYFYAVEDILMDSSTNKMYTNNVTTTVTMYEETDGTITLDVVLTAKNYLEGQYPFIERILVADSTTNIGLVGNIVPESFYEEGPGKEPASVAEKRAAMKAALDPIVTGNNFTLTHNYSTYTYTANVYSDHAFAFSGSNFTYGYYFLDLNEEKTNSAKAGLRVYQNANSQEQDGLISNMSMDYIKQAFTSQGYTVDENYVAKKTGATDINLVERMFMIWEQNFNPISYIKADYDNFWTNLYNGSWADQLLYSTEGDFFIVNDYYLKQALFGYDTLISNYSDQVSLDLHLVGSTLYADTSIFTTDGSDFGYASLGTITFSNIGTTLLPETFATYVNNAHGTNFKVANQTAE